MHEPASPLFALVPFLAWAASGSLKFAIHAFRFGADARRHIGNGGFPSTHTSVVSSVTMLIGFESGWDSPLFGLGAALTFIVMIDAVGIRRAVGQAAERINALTRRLPAEDVHERCESGEAPLLREKQGHTRFEVAGGLAVGTAVAWGASCWM